MDIRTLCEKQGINRYKDDANWVLSDDPLWRWTGLLSMHYDDLRWYRDGNDNVRIIFLLWED